LKSEGEIDFSKGSKLDHTTGFHGYCFMEQGPVRSEIMGIGMALFEHKITATGAPRWLGIGNIAFAPRDSPALETEEWEEWEAAATPLMTMILRPEGRERGSRRMVCQFCLHAYPYG
jgi:hypothetical protein